MGGSSLKKQAEGESKQPEAVSRYYSAWCIVKKCFYFDITNLS